MRLDDALCFASKAAVRVSLHPDWTMQAVRRHFGGDESCGNDWVFLGINASLIRRRHIKWKLEAEQRLMRKAIAECESEGRQYIADYRKYRSLMIFCEHEKVKAKARECRRIIKEIENGWRN